MTQNYAHQIDKVDGYTPHTNIHTHSILLLLPKTLTVYKDAWQNRHTDRQTNRQTETYQALHSVGNVNFSNVLHETGGNGAQGLIGPL